MKLGLNLYSIKTLMQNEEDFLATTLKLKEMGYEVLQFSGATFNAEMIKRVSEQTGVPFVLTHVGYDRIVGDTQKLMEEHALFGCKNIGLGALSIEEMNDEDLFKDRIEKLNEAGEVMKKNGFKFFYHNHHTEMTRLKNGELKLYYMLKNMPNINFTLDTYWLQYGGLNPVKVFNDFKDRIECVHLKDYRVVYKEEAFKPEFAPCGEGTLDLKALIKAGLESGAKYFLVEQDDAIRYENPLLEVEKSINYLKEITK